MDWSANGRSHYDVLNNRLKSTAAAVKHGVPRSTLNDRLSGRVIHDTKPGPKPYLTTAEEKELAEQLIEAASLGYGKLVKKLWPL